MVRKAILSAVIGLGLLTPLAAVPAAEAQDRNESRESHHRDWERHHHSYEVMYRSCCNDPWNCYGRFDSREDAEHAEHHLRRQGFEAFVR